MKLRFMCLKHYCDLNIDGHDHNDFGLVDQRILLANGDGTYEFDFSNFSCPEQNAFLNQRIAAINNQEAIELAALEIQGHTTFASAKYWDDLRQASQDELNNCGETWTVTLYSNFTKIGDDTN